MRRRPDTERKHVMLRAGDMDKLRELFPRAGPSTVIRHIVANMVDSLEVERLEKVPRSIREISEDESVQQLILAAVATDPGESEEPADVVRQPSRRSN